MKYAITAVMPPVRSLSPQADTYDVVSETSEVMRHTALAAAIDLSFHERKSASQSRRRGTDETGITYTRVRYRNGDDYMPGDGGRFAPEQFLPFGQRAVLDLSTGAGTRCCAPLDDPQAGT